MSTATAERRAFIDRMAARVQSGVAAGGRMISDGVDVTDEVFAAAGYGGELRVLDREFAWTAETGRADVMDVDPVVLDQVARSVVAYACTWSPIREWDAKRGGWIWRSLGPDTFGTIDHAAVPLRIDHTGEVLGRFIYAEPDEHGLKMVGILDDTPAGRRALNDMRSGRVRCFSVAVANEEALSLGETRDGEPAVKVVRARLLDAGPATGTGGDPFDGPADARARILSVGGRPVEDRTWHGDDDLDALGALTAAELAAEIADYLGMSPAKVLDASGFNERRRTERARERRALWDRLAGELKAARVKAARAYRSQLDPYGGKASPAELQAAIRAAEVVEARLLDAVCNDRTVFAELCDRFGIPGAVQQTGRWAALADSIRGGRR